MFVKISIVNDSSDAGLSVLIPIRPHDLASKNEIDLCKDDDLIHGVGMLLEQYKKITQNKKGL